MAGNGTAVFEMSPKRVYPSVFPDLSRPGECIMDITPDIARRMLEANTNNRKVVNSQVRSIAEMISRGEWRRDHPHPIVFGVNGVLLDGQHRLMAISESGVTVTSRVIMGADPKVREYIDTNKSRDLADRVRFCDNLAENKAVGKIIRSSIFLKNKGRRVVSSGLALEVYNQNPASVQFGAAWLCEAVRGVCRAGVAIALIDFHRQTPKAAEVFADALLQADGPIQQARMLRDFLIRSARTGGGTYRILDDYERTVNCVTAYLRGRDVVQVKRSSSWPWEQPE